MGAYFHEHIFHWFVRMISVLTLTHNYSSLKLLFGKKKCFSFFKSAHKAVWFLTVKVRSAACFSFLFSIFYKVSRSQINKRSQWVSQAGVMPSVLCESEHQSFGACQSHPVWFAELQLWLCMFPGKKANKIFCRAAQASDFVFHQETPQAHEHRSCKILPDKAETIPFNLGCPARNKQFFEINNLSVCFLLLLR